MRQHRVTYLGCEDRFNEFYYRLLSILEYLNGVRGPDEKEIKLTDLDGWFDPIILVGRDSILWERDPKTGNCITPAYLRLCERMRASGTEILIVDGVADTFGGNINSPAEVKRYMNSMLAPVNEDRGAVLLIAHVGHRRE